ncbi:ExbD/TolR family protein [Oscillatoria salina]|uniref:ExbD/TolR family protein n=1 Tax=Oscillatoria salina TaxID=331517 RepID=UPI0013BAA335|nr:biopolymer transporter ExbD [Oscillatoria salina]MBZ8180447.1 biopolymer transporter ExbD [Oscillatoria salina IIICB1]NET89459.1 biopolymer transporter ExbD [Kamptonema sp. SIO1D9]
MRFKTRQENSKIPTIDLIPMLNVMMAVLAFFVLISTTLLNELAVDVQLPTNTEASDEPLEDLPEPYLVELTASGIFQNEQPLTKEQLFTQIQAYLNENNRGAVLLKADNQVPYEQVIQLLVEMKDIGGENVSLAIESES